LIGAARPSYLTQTAPTNREADIPLKTSLHMPTALDRHASGATEDNYDQVRSLLQVVVFMVSHDVYIDS
jgi:hypothetical protein